MKKFGIHPLFLILGIVFCILGYYLTFFVYIFVVILHELAHLFVAKKLGYKLDKIFLMPYGASLSLNQNFVNEKDEIIIAFAGPILNFGFVIICISFWWLFPSTYNFTQEFVMANFVTGLINLLPCYPLDGGRILSAVLKQKIKNNKKIIKICNFFNYFICFLFIFIFFINIFKYFTFVIMAIFIFLGTFESKFNGQYNLNSINFLGLNIKHKSVLDVNSIAVNSNIELYKITKYIKKNKYNIIYVLLNDGNVKVLNEQLLEKIFLNCNLTTKLNKILIKN